MALRQPTDMCQHDLMASASAACAQVPNRKLALSPPKSGTGTNQYPGLNGWPLTSNGAANFTNNRYDCGTDATNGDSTPPDTFNLNLNGNPVSPCAGNAVGQRGALLQHIRRLVAFAAVLYATQED